MTKIEKLIKKSSKIQFEDYKNYMKQSTPIQIDLFCKVYDLKLDKKTYLLGITIHQNLNRIDFLFLRKTTKKERREVQKRPWLREGIFLSKDVPILGRIQYENVQDINRDNWLVYLFTKSEYFYIEKWNKYKKLERKEKLKKLTWKIEKN